MVQILLAVLGIWLLSSVAILVVAWPYKLGVYIAVQQGVDEYGGQAFMLGWFLQSIYIAAFVALAVFERSRRRGSKSNPWKVFAAFWLTIVTVTGLASIWPGAPT